MQIQGQIILCYGGCCLDFRMLIISLASTNQITSFVVGQSLITVWLFETLWTAAHRISLSFTISPSLFKSYPLGQECDPTISYSVAPFSWSLQSFSASGSFSMSQLFSSGGHSIGASTSVLPMNIQNWFPLGTTGLISLLSKGLESSPAPQFESISSSALSLLYGPTLTSVHDYRKNHSFDYTDLCWQSDVSAF